MTDYDDPNTYDPDPAWADQDDDECHEPWHAATATPDGTHPGPVQCPSCGDWAEPFSR